MTDASGKLVDEYEIETEWPDDEDDPSDSLGDTCYHPDEIGNLILYEIQQRLGVR